MSWARMGRKLRGEEPMVYEKGGGGGQQTQTTSGGIDPEFKPYIKTVLADVTSEYGKEKAGGGRQVSSAYSGLQSAAQQLGAEAAAERGNLDRYSQEGAGAQAARAAATNMLNQDYDQVIAQDLQNVAGNQTASSLGTLGSSRGDRARQAALSDRALQLRQAEASQRTAAAGTLAGLDTSEQQRYMNALGAKSDLGKSQYMASEYGVKAAEGMADAPYRAADRYFGYLGSGAVPTQQTTTSTGGGGK